MVEYVLARRLPDCSDVLTRLSREDIIRVLQSLLEVERVTVKGDKVEIVYLHKPDEFTKRRLKTKIEVRLGKDEVVARGKGALNIELALRCSGDELVAGLTVYGKGESAVTRENLEKVVKMLIDRIEELARPITPPTPPAPAAAPPAPTAPPTPSTAPVERPVEKPAPPPPLPPETLGCEGRLFTAGLPVDEELSRRIPSEIHPEASHAGVVVEEGEGETEKINLASYRDGYVLRIYTEKFMVEVARLGDKVGVYFRNYLTGEEFYGEEAVRRAAERLCRPGARASYMVIKLPR